MKKTLNILSTIIRLTVDMNVKYVILLFVFSLLSLAIPIVGMYNTQDIVNNIQKGVDFFSFDFIILLIVFPCISIISELVNRIMTYISARYSDILNYQYSCAILEKVHTHGLSDFENPEFYDLLQRAEEAGGIYPFSIMSGIINIITQLITSLSYVTILFMWKKWTLLILIIFPILSSIQIASISKNEYQVFYNRTTLERKSWYYAHLQNKDMNIKETILFSLFDYFFDKFKEIRLAFLNENKKMYIKRNISTMIIFILSTIGTMVILYMIFYEASIGLIMIGSLMTYISSVSNFKSSFSGVVSSVFQVYNDSLYAENIVDFLNWNMKQEKGIDEKKYLINEIESIELQDVSFKYHNSTEYALKNINLILNKGSKYVVVGRNGSGKTTLAKLLLGFYDNYEGEIYVNKINLKEININSFRLCISSVFQDYTRYQSSIEEAINISDLTNHSDSDVVDAAEKANASMFINKLNHKYKQQVGSWFPDGVQLSGGEWQKIAIARAFYRKFSSFVVCDELSSSLDPISERRVYDSFLELTKGKLGLFITHRLKRYNLLGEIIVLKNGEIVERGEQARLLSDDTSAGEFRELYDHEMLDEVMHG